MRVPGRRNGSLEMFLDPNAANPHQEPCLSYGEETAVGSVFYSDRSAVDNPDGTRGYLCSECSAHVRSAGHREGLSEVRRLGGLMAIGISATRH
jgi:hypothetical protein